MKIAKRILRFKLLTYVAIEWKMVKITLLVWRNIDIPAKNPVYSKAKRMYVRNIAAVSDWSARV